MENQELLLLKIKERLRSQDSLNDKIAETLQISYDAAHRRVSGKSKFSLDEVVLLCQKFDLSFNEIFMKESKIIVEKTKTIRNLADFKSYIEKSSELLMPFYDNRTEAYYCAKDIPLHYILDGSLFSKFKIYCWMYILIKGYDISFDEFTMESQMMGESMTISKVFEKAKVIEIWNETTINGTFHQIMFFVEAGLLSYTKAILMLEDVRQIIKRVENRCNNEKDRFELYVNELLVLNNTVLLINQQKMSYFIPHNMLSYLVSNQRDFCIDEKEFIENQLLNSKCISKAGNKEQRMFFNKIYQKIDFYKNKVESMVEV